MHAHVNIAQLQSAYSKRTYVERIFILALIDDNSSYILNGHNVITQYPRTFAYGGITFEYSGTNATMEKVNTSYARKLTRNLRVQVAYIRFIGASMGVILNMVLDFVTNRLLSVS